MAIGLKPDTSYLFSNLNNSNSSSSIFDMSFLSDYNSIKSGSYGKLVKAYYKKLESEESSTTSEKDKTSNDKVSTSLAEDSSKTLTAVKSSTSSLSELASDFAKDGEEKLLVKKDVTTKLEDGTSVTTKEYDMDAIYKSISGFVDKYNSVIESSKNSEASGIKKATTNMTNITDLYANSLKKLGITINADKTLTVDEKTFKSAEIADIKDTFTGNSSFSKSISSQASFINDAATREGAKANTYTNSGSYSENYSTGDLFSSLF